MIRLSAALVAATALAFGQGKPVQIAASCSYEAAQTLNLPCTAEEPCPLFLELANAEQVGPRLVIAGNIHTGAATIESILLASDDGGRTWTEPIARIPGAVLDQIQFLDFEAGWINGHILTNGPRDAFFLLTTDGGKTWRRRPVSSESRTGVVEQFWFESRSSGRLALDRVRMAENGMRFEVWESLTGGESWSVRQVDSRPVPFKRPPRDSILRLRTDARTKTNRLEKNEGDKWGLIASFAVGVGQCKPEPPAAPEPAEPTEPVVVEETPAPAPAPSKSRRPPTLKKP